MFGKALKLSQKGMLLAAIPLVSEIALIACLSLIIIDPLESQVRKSAGEYAANLALSCLHNDVMLLQHVLNSTLKRQDYLAPDWLLKWMKDQNERFAQAGKGKLDHADRDSAEALAIASEEPQQLQLLSEKDFRYWTGQADQHMRDMETAARGHDRLEKYAMRYHQLLDRFFQSVSEGRADLQEGKTDDAIKATAAARLALKQTETLMQQEGAQLRANEEDLIRSKDNLDESRLDEISSQFRSILLGGLLANVMSTVVLVIVFGRGTQFRLSAVMKNMALLSQDKKLNPSLSGTDELAEIDRSFHEMAGRLEAARAKERAIVDNATDVLCALNENDQFEQVNPAAERIWGFNPSALLKDEVVKIIAPEEKENTRKALSRARELSEPISFESSVIRPDGSLVSTLWTGRFSDKDGLTLCVARDITEQKAIARMKEEFITMISNDLRKPLQFHDEFLLKLGAGTYGEFNKDGLARLTKVGASTKRLLGLVNDLLDLERLTTGRLDLKLAPVSTATLMDRAIDSVSVVAESKSIQLACTGPDLTINADGDRLVQVLVNLVGNALKFSPSQSTITMSAELDEDVVVFRVSDQGRGIPEDLRKSIFERFKQVTRTDATEKGGTGLGLSICQKIVESHGGEIGVDSVDGKGSTFWFRLPVVEPDEA